MTKTTIHIPTTRLKKPRSIKAQLVEHGTASPNQLGRLQSPLARESSNDDNPGHELWSSKGKSVDDADVRAAAEAALFKKIGQDQAQGDLRRGF